MVVSSGWSRGLDESKVIGARRHKRASPGAFGKSDRIVMRESR
jgi:hypothetical protein